MENDILDALDDLGYEDAFDETVLAKAVEGGSQSPVFTKLCAWITGELKGLCDLEECVHPTQSPDDTEGFEMEMSSFLSEFGCPHAGVSSGDSAQRFRTKENCLVLLDYLLTELQAAQMTHANHPRPPSTPTGQAPASLHSGELKAICITLGMSRPPPNITTFQFFTGVEKKLREFLSKVPQDHIGKPLMKRAMAPGQWAQLDIINRKLSEEYRIRREMLLKRLDVTIQSFNWSNKTKGKEDAVAQAFRPKRQGLSTQTNVILADLLSAREDIARMQKTTYGATRHNCAINKVLMGRVPDRGGRAWERAPPPKEMPAFKKREDGGRGGFGGGRGGQRGMIYE
ncbi:FAM98A [Branchiostoma lanceolatum]|uniref:FAM98A protein n=1 Tax=Branchiostoma lanceolatum TaxID=7740 RepID=A0A8J9ZQS0_BRALA|nr:FAM98A [Branchiostoma lanceolatum]